MPASPDAGRASTKSSAPLEVACDESGSDGENLIESRHRVFAHGSVDCSVEEANSIAAAIRKRFRIAGTELKASRLLRDDRGENVAALFGPGELLDGRAHLVLIDKLYFAVGKVIDLLVEEYAYEHGVHLHGDGSARQIASTLFRRGRKALGSADWERLLGAFVSLIRRRQRTGAKTTLDAFYAVLDDVRLRSHDRDVSKVLGLVWAAREEAAQYGEPGNWIAQNPNLEPLLAAILPTADHWATHHGRPVSLVHDRQTILTDELVSTIIEIANHPHPEFPNYVPLVGVSQVDSKTDARVQLADLVAGLGRLSGEQALAGTLTPSVVSGVRPMLDGLSVWDDESSWKALAGRAVGT